MQEQVRTLLREFCAKLNERFWNEGLARKMRSFRSRPAAFAAQILGSRWWNKQEEVAESVASHRRTAVKSANGVGKTYLAADLVLWFLYTHRPGIVLTTAPTWRQVRHLLWEEIRRRFSAARLPLPGKLLSTRLNGGEGWFALGLATGDPVKFQGFHAEHMLIVFDEASGIPDSIWEAAEGVAVGKNNRILAIGNPLQASGKFYRLFRGSSGWRRHSISAMEHPNVTGRGPAIPGAVTPEAITERVAEWCEEATNDEGRTTNADTFDWRGRRYVPNNLFRTRVLGEFPDADDEALIPLRWVEAAMARTLPESGYKRMAVDVARFGSDSTVIGVRVGTVVTRMEVFHGNDLMETAGRIVRMAYEEHPESIAVDAVGIGAGVVDRLMEIGLDGVEGMNAGHSAFDMERFINRRAELYWNLRERLRTGDISLPKDEQMAQELAGIRYTHTSRGQIKIENKEDMRKRGMASPDRADMLALLFDGGYEMLAAVPERRERVPSAARLLREEMAGW